MSTEQQRKMMECAAKACGYKIFDWYGERYTAHDGEKLIAFNPLTNPADTAEMCAKLGIGTLFFDNEQKVSCGFLAQNKGTALAHIEQYGVSRLKAWMHDATMVAAKIGGLK